MSLNRKEMKILRSYKTAKSLKVLALTTALTLACGAFASCGNEHKAADTSSAETTNSTAENSGETAQSTGDFVTDLLPTTDEDIPANSFIITLREDKAPISCENFEKLVSEGFYDGLTFHRIFAGFMAQGGSSTGTGVSSGDEETIKGEFKSNGVDNDLSHKRSIVSMARTNDPDSASTQFFICYNDDVSSSLDGNYAAFAQVTQGMEVVDRFLNCDRELNDTGYGVPELSKPVSPITITKATMIEPDANGHKRALFTVDFTEHEFTEGEFIVTIHPDKAPITCENFEKLVNEGFYDGLSFHRVMDGFMAQGGDPEGTGFGGADEEIKGEFPENGVDNDLKHLRGTISMARAADPNSASSQFFICYKDLASLDGKYAAFGEVTEGMEVVDGFTTVCRGYTQTVNPEDAELSVPGTPITIEKAVMIDNDENGDPRIKFTVRY